MTGETECHSESSLLRQVFQATVQLGCVVIFLGLHVHLQLYLGEDFVIFGSVCDYCMSEKT
jgi:hypothetical protein